MSTELDWTEIRSKLTAFRKDAETLKRKLNTVLDTYEADIASVNPDISEGIYEARLYLIESICELNGALASIDIEDAGK